MFVVTGTPRSATGYASLLFKELKIPCSHERVFKPRATLHDVLTWYADRFDKGESSWLAWTFLSLLPGPVKVLHTVRNPWTVVDSLAHRNDLIPLEAKLDRGKRQFRDVIEWYCPRVNEYENAVDRAAVMVVEWNHHIEVAVEQRGMPYKRYRVEDLDAAAVDSVLEWLGIYRDKEEIEDALRHVPNNVNGGKRIEYDIEIKNPLVKAHLKEVMPDVEPKIARLFSVDRPRSQREVEDLLAPELVDSLRQLAHRYGYEVKETRL